MKRLFLLFFVLAAVLLSSVPTTTASLYDDIVKQRGAAGRKAGFNEVRASEPQLIIATIIRAFLSLLGTIFLVLLLYGGFLWMTAGGNEEQIEKAKKMIRNAVIGLVIILSAYAITRFIETSLNSGRGVF